MAVNHPAPLGKNFILRRLIVGSADSMNPDDIKDALKSVFVPKLRELGFAGTLPHFRRRGTSRIDLLTVQFDRYGGGFVVEISRCPLDGVTTHWGKHIPPNKVTAHDLHPDLRQRLGSPRPGVDGVWFRFDDGTNPLQAAESLCAYLDEAARWWSAG